MKKMLLAIVAILVSTVAFSQVTITGTVVDGDQGPLPGASVLVEGTSTGVSTDFDGNFSIETSQNSGTLIVSYVGFISKKIQFSGTSNVGTVSLTEDSEQLQEVIVIGSGVIDLAEGRKTPIAVTTIKRDVIQEKAGNFDLPEILKSTPSVQNIRGGGFGDGSMFLRGFDQTNTAFLLNGQPINGMEDGKMYWSNWSGILDVAEAVQVQRGLGSSKLAISSVGGTVNIVTKTIDMKKGGFVQTSIANDNFIKTNAYYSTGMNEKGWSFSAMLGHWQGDGYVDYTAGQGQTYFFSVGYKLSEDHIFNFILTGAPQWHVAAGRGTIKEFLDNGIKHNPWTESGVDSPNTVGKGGIYPGGRNIYHKPVANLSWDWNIDEKSSLSSVLYGSLGRGAFASERITDGVGYARGSYNNHNWFGLVTNYNHKLSETLDFNIGADVRTYKGIHFRGVNELIGIDGVDSSSEFSGDYTVTNTYGGINPWSMLFNPNTSHSERLTYDYEEVITYYGAFSQLEYSKDKFAAFFQGAISNQDHLKTDYFNFSVATDSEKISNIGYNVKGGAAYEFNQNNQVFVNAGYYSRQPFHDDLFDNVRNSNDLINPAVDNQTITGLEAGYKFGIDGIKVNLNVYHTTWDNRTVLGNNGENFEEDSYRAFQTLGVKQVHSGVELEIFTRPIDNLTLNGYISVGDWKFKGDGTQRTFDNEGEEVGSSEQVIIDGFKVGGAAQITAGINGKYKFNRNFSLDANYNYYNDFYSEGSLTKETLELPSYGLVDAGATYKFWVGKEKRKSVQIRTNINNLFNEKYLESVFGNTAASANPAENYGGVNVDNNGRFGYGTTWNLSLRYNF